MEATICEVLESHAGIVRDPLGVKFDEAGCGPFGEILLPSIAVKWALIRGHRSCCGTARAIIIITRTRIGPWVGVSAAHRQIVERIETIASTDAEVLITGPGGPGGDGSDSR